MAVTTPDDTALLEAFSEHLHAAAALGVPLTLDDAAAELVAVVRLAGYAKRSDTLAEAAEVINQEESPFHSVNDTEAFWKAQSYLAAAVTALTASVTL